MRRTGLVLMGLGLALLAVWVGARVHRAVGSRASLAAFERDALASSRGQDGPARAAAGGQQPVLPGDVDVSLWSEQRVRAYRESLATPSTTPIAVLKIPRVDLVVPVLPGTDELTLNRGVGHIEGTALPGTVGNVGIAGHRDGFFRGLKDLAVGDRLELVTLDHTEAYRVESLTIVPPEQVSVLDPTSVPTVTLVTCYPFYFVGHAPQRFIVRATRVERVD